MEEWLGFGREGRMLFINKVRAKKKWHGIHNRDNDLVHCDGVVWGGVIGREGSTMVLWSCYGTSVTGAERG